MATSSASLSRKNFGWAGPEFGAGSSGSDRD